MRLVLLGLAVGIFALGQSDMTASQNADRSRAMLDAAARGDVEALKRMPDRAVSRLSDGRFCERLRMPAMTTAPRTPTAGVRKRPTDEIAGWGR
jgi:hypothetical protein